MYVVYKFKHWNIFPRGTPKFESKFTRLKEFETINEADEYMQSKKDHARNIGSDAIYTIRIEKGESR